MKKFLLVLALFACTYATQAQIRIGGDFGFATATGDFGADGSLGIGFAGHAAWAFTPKISAGIEVDRSAIVTVSSGDGVDIDATGLSGYLAKGYYHFLDKKFSPYFGLGMGLYNVEFPTVTITDGNGNTTVIEGENKVNFGFAPELGLQMGWFTLGAKYSLAGKLPGGSDINANYLRFYLGFRFGVDDLF